MTLIPFPLLSFVSVADGVLTFTPTTLVTPIVGAAVAAVVAAAVLFVLWIGVRAVKRMSVEGMDIPPAAGTASYVSALGELRVYQEMDEDGQYDERNGGNHRDYLEGLVQHHGLTASEAEELYRQGGEAR